MSDPLVIILPIAHVFGLLAVMEREHSETKPTLNLVAAFPALDVFGNRVPAVAGGWASYMVARCFRTPGAVHEKARARAACGPVTASRESPRLRKCAKGLRADHDGLHPTVDQHAPALQVRLPRALARVERVAARLAELLAPACKIALSHCEYPLLSTRFAPTQRREFVTPQGDEFTT